MGALADARRELGEGVTSSVVITTLGGFRVIRDGEPVDVGEWGSRKARDLVKLLVARRGAPVVRDEVTDLLWPEEPDRSARRLSVLLSMVRTVFDPRQDPQPRLLRRRRSRHGVARARPRRHRRRTIHRRGGRRPADARCRRSQMARTLLADAGPVTSVSSAPMTRTPTGRRVCASWPSTPSSTPASSWRAGRRPAGVQRGDPLLVAHPRRRSLRRGSPPRPRQLVALATPSRRGSPRLPPLQRQDARTRPRTRPYPA